MPAQFGLKLKHLRLQHKLTQGELTEILGISSRANLSHLETSRNIPTMAMVLRMATRFAVSLDYLLRDSVPAESPFPPRGVFSAATAPDFGKRLRQLRLEHDLTQSELAQRLGLDGHAFISKLEAGHKAPSIELVLAIADLFEVSADFLFTAEGAC